MTNYQPTMSDADFEAFAVADPYAAIGSGDTRVATSDAAFKACAEADGWWAISWHPVRLLQFPALADKAVLEHPRYFMDDAVWEDADEVTVEDPITAEARSILEQMWWLNMSDGEAPEDEAAQRSALAARREELVKKAPGKDSRWLNNGRPNRSTGNSKGNSIT